MDNSHAMNGRGGRYRDDDQPDSTGLVSLAAVMDTVLRYKFLLFACVALAVGAALVYRSLVQPVYEVTSKVVVQREGSPLSDRHLIRYDEQFLATQSEILASPAVIQQAVQSTQGEVAFDSEIDPVLHVLSSLNVKPLSGTNVLGLSYRCEQPNEGLILVSAMLAAYRQHLQEMDAGSRLDTLRQLTRSEQQVREELKRREQRYLELQRESPLVVVGKDRISQHEQILERLAASLADAESERMNYQQQMTVWTRANAHPVRPASHPSELRLLTPPVSDRTDSSADNRWNPADASWNSAETYAVRRPGFSVESPGFSVENAGFSVANTSPPPVQTAGTGWPAGLGFSATLTIPGQPNADELGQELHRAQLRRDELEHSCGPDHPEMKAIVQRIASLQRRWDDHLQQIPTALQQEIEVATAREHDLRRLYEDTLAKVKQEKEYAIMEQQELDGIARLENIYGSLISQLNDWRLIEPEDDQAWGTTVSIIAAPNIGTGPIWPRTKVLLAVSAAIGLVLGACLIVLIEAYRHRAVSSVIPAEQSDQTTRSAVMI